MIAIPFFIYFSLCKMPLTALFIFVFASITDYFDGYMARKYQIVSNFGKVMDPLADKLLVVSALIILNINPIAYISWVVTSIIALREIVVSYLRYHYTKKQIYIPADIYGKLKTITQLVGIIFALVFFNALHLSFFSFLIPYKENVVFFIQIYFWVVAIITIVSGINYFMMKKQATKLP
jgi:CDP-diacylglycerol--glycerol-3-phosphate 3-phosphatidyltransferase